MSIDTATERLSALGFGQVWFGLVFPDGLISRGDRQALAFLYSGIEAAEPESDITEYLIHSKAIAQWTIITDTTLNTVLNIIGDTHFILAGSVKRINFLIGITGGSSVDLSGFTVEAQLVKDGRWIEMENTWGATTDEDNFLLHSEDDLEALVHDTHGVAMLDVLGIWAIRFKSKMASLPGEAVTRTLEVSAALTV